MHQKIFTVFAAAALALLCACGSSDTPHAVRTESTEEAFSITEAEALIRPYDKAAAWLGAQDTITRAEAEAVVRDVDAAFPGEGENVLGMFIDMARWEEEERQTLDVVPHSFCPTMFHEGVAVTSVVQTTDVTEYEDGSVWKRVWLEVTETYTGDEESLADWERSYLFEQTDEGDWVFFSFDGQMNFSGEKWSSGFLPLKSPADEIYTPYT